MSETHTSKPPVWFWIVSGLALVWNLLGVWAYITLVTRSDADIAKLPEAEQAILAVQPAWVTGVFALAVFAGALGCGALLLRKKLALALFAASLIGVIAQQVYFFILTDIGKSLGSAALVMPISIVVVALALLWFAQKSATKNWIN